jgi:hypothetical protein
MRRFAPSTTLARVTGVRTVYSIFGSTIREPNTAKNSHDHIFTSLPTARCHAVHYSPAVDTIGTNSGVSLSGPEQYLLSAIEDDIVRLTALDWTVEFDSFWKDRIRSHEMTFETLYIQGRRPLRKYLLGNFSDNVAARDAVQARLTYLQSILQIAEGTERRFSTVAKTRFRMQREVFDPLEREKLLAACVEAVDAWTAEVPSVFQRKVKMELELHVSNLRHWVNDSPNAKMWFSRRLA